MAEFSLETLLPTMEETFRTGGCFRIYPRGVSMLPLLREGIDSVLLCRDRAPAVGDIVLFRRPSGSFILHRVYKIEGDSFYAVADNQPSLPPEGPLPLSSITARVSGVFRENTRMSEGELTLYRLYASAKRGLHRGKVKLKKLLGGKKR